jgi:hypothetical protein
MLLRPRHLELLLWIAFGALLLAGVPIFLCMPPWLDVTLYDVAAHNVLHGGVPYRDVFDTNLPGPLWLHMLVRYFFGYGSEAIRVLDLAFVAGIIFLLARWLERLGLPRMVQIGAALVLTLFYLSTSELCHCQRDVWMLLPALGALHLRCWQIVGLRKWRLGILEGLLWGAAFWIKPFVAVPALAAWIYTAILSRKEMKQIGMDAASVLVGGLLAGGLGVTWLIWSGAWSPFWHVLTVWNPEYAAHARAIPLAARMKSLFGPFQTWDLAPVVAVPLALVSTVHGLSSSKRGEPKSLLGLLAMFYLAWLGQAVFLQQVHEYTQVPALLLAWALLIGFVALLPASSLRLASAAGLAVLIFVAASRHPLFRPGRLTLWPRCWKEGSSPELRNRLSLVHAAHSPDWVRLAEVADFLRGLDLTDGQLTCYNCSTHPLYLMLDLRPSTPFLHFDLLFICCPGRTEDIRTALAQSGEQYLVSDLQAVLDDPDRTAAVNADDPQGLPLPRQWRGIFPWDQPIVFRSGRYVVHRVNGTVGPLLPRPHNSARAASGD